MNGKINKFKENISEARKEVAKVRAKLPDLIKLTPEERASLKVLHELAFPPERYAQDEPPFPEKYLSPKYDRLLPLLDDESRKQFVELREEIRDINERFADTMLVLHDKALSKMFEMYDIAKAEAEKGNESAKKLYADLLALLPELLKNERKKGVGN